jgi:hypothetical protein
MTWGYAGWVRFLNGVWGTGKMGTGVVGTGVQGERGCQGRVWTGVYGTIDAGNGVTGVSGSESERLRGSVGCVSERVCGVCARAVGWRMVAIVRECRGSGCRVE